MGRHQREAQSLALLLVDVDCFKALNDASGHLYGDECLRTLARLCSDSARNEDDLIARYGGEELALLLPCCERDEAGQVAEHLRRRVKAEAMLHPASPVASHVTVSIGVSAVRPGEASLPETLIRGADRALYAAKAQGRDCVVVRGISE